MGPISSELTLTKERRKRKKERGGRKEEKRKTAMVALLFSFYNGYFGEKKLLDTKGLFGGNVFKNPVRHTGEGKLRKSSEANL